MTETKRINLTPMLKLIGQTITNKPVEMILISSYDYKNPQDTIHTFNSDLLSSYTGGKRVDMDNLSTFIKPETLTNLTLRFLTMLEVILTREIGVNFENIKYLDTIIHTDKELVCLFRVTS